jgi:proline dehydrogenase
MLESISKHIFHLLANRTTLQRLASTVGMRQPTSFARRFIAGETVAEAIEAGRAVEARGLRLTLDHLGENITSLAEAGAATSEYLALIDAIVASGIGRNISLKLTQLGLDVEGASAADSLRTILERADPAGFFVRLDMESSRYTDVTLDVFETLWRQGFRNLGVVLQATLRRSEEDLRRVNALGGHIRLVKGAYTEPRSIAYARKSDVDAAFARMMRVLLVEGHYPAIATHDEVMLDLARRWAADHGVTADRFEFQMLYGVRRDLQAMLVSAGYRVRVYIPFGRQWFPYFMRRLGERPANLAFIVRSLLGEERQTKGLESGATVLSATLGCSPRLRN